MKCVPTRQQGISPNKPAHAILIKVLSIMKSKCPDTRFAFTPWFSPIVNQNYQKEKKNWQNHFDNRNTVQSALFKLPGIYQNCSNFEMF